MKTRGAAAVIVLAAVLLGGIGTWGMSKTKWFSKRSKQAATSTQTTNELLAAQQKQGAVAAASVVKIGEANSVAPDSPAKVFISREVPVALASLPPPDVEALIAAERRKVAILEGRLMEADKLYGVAMQRADEYQKEAQRAIAAKRASDLALEQAAAQELGSEQTKFYLMLVAIAAGLLWAYNKVTHISPGALASAVADIRNGTTEPNSAIAAIDSATTPAQQMMVKANVWFKKKRAQILSP